MKQNYTHITLVVDRSGSMASCRDDADGGINTFIKEQQKQPGEASFTMVEFDTVADTLYNGIPLRAVDREYKLIPRGNTALNDAVAAAISETGQFLKAIPEPARPGLVIFAIVTDGEENSSVKYRGRGNAQVREMIKHQQEVYNWRFEYLGANQDAFAAAKELEIPTSGTIQYGTRWIGASYAALSGKTSRMRNMASAGLDTQAVGYTPAERAASVGAASPKDLQDLQEALDASKNAEAAKS